MEHPPPRSTHGTGGCIGGPGALAGRRDRKGAEPLPDHAFPGVGGDMSKPVDGVGLTPPEPPSHGVDS